MTIKTKITFSQYAKLIYTLAYKKLILRLLLAVAFLLLLWIVFYNLDIFALPKPLIYQYLTLFLIAVVQPIAIFLLLRRNYKSSNQLQETSVYEIAPHGLKINGESYYMEIKWEKFFEIVERPKWFLLYQNSMSAIMISKRDMTQHQIIDFRNVLRNIDNNIPVELMETSASTEAIVG